MPTKCFSSVRGRVARFTKLNNAGTPQSDPRGMVTTDGFITVSYAPEIKDGEEIEVINASGGLCVSDTSPPQLKWFNVEIEFCNIDPSAINLLTGNEIVTDTGANDVGFRVKEAIGTANFALEVWTDIPASSPKAFGYFLLPYVVQGVVQDFTIENDALTMTVKARTAKGSGWGTGPHLVVPSSTGAAAKLQSPIGATDHLHLQTTTIAPPAAVCGPTALTVT